MTDETPPPPPPPVAAPPDVPPPGPAVVTETTARTGPHPALMLLAGFLIGLLIGLGTAWAVWHS